MNTTFEDVRVIMDRWVDEAITHLTTTFPQVSRQTLIPVVHEQVVNAVEALLTTKLTPGV